MKLNRHQWAKSSEKERRRIIVDKLEVCPMNTEGIALLFGCIQDHELQEVKQFLFAMSKDGLVKPLSLDSSWLVSVPESQRLRFEVWGTPSDQKLAYRRSLLHFLQRMFRLRFPKRVSSPHSEYPRY